MIEGRLSFDQWNDDKGQKHSKHSIIVETMQMVDSKSNAANSDDSDNLTQPNNVHNYPDQTKTVPKVAVDNFNPFDDGIKEEEIPF
jgi:single-strand DNA-binding protein